MGKRFVVIGANHAGIACVNQLLALNPDDEIYVFDRNSNISFLGCGMALWIGNQITKGEGLFYSSKEDLEAKGAHVYMETTVDCINYQAKTITYHQNKSDDSQKLPFDKLIIATGSSPIIPSIPGIDLAYIQRAKLFQDAQLAVEQIAHDEHIRNVVVVGAGYIGAELAEAYERVGKRVVLIDALDRILGTHFDKDFSDVMKTRLESHGITVALDQKVQAFEGDNQGRVCRVVTNQEAFDADLVMMCIGFKPNNELGANKLELFSNGAILVDAKQQTSVPDVYAIGDCATIYDNSLRATSYIALATNAVRSGLVAAFNASGVEIPSLGVQGSSGLCLYGLKMVCTGQTVSTAAEHGIEAEMCEYTAKQKPGFMDEAGANPEVHMRIVYRKDDHSVIGAQLMSEHDMSAALHMFSLAIQEHVSIEHIALCDIFFMPHFNEPYNYITMAALSAVKL
ncbi:MAG: FAD-dependent oxidoreductase [Atopobium sp.]|uniref:H2O-forming NADH oxidase n=1 Tax=Atopobium sp. TaxID=1872650 RepID=UPI002A7FC385|nr:FAD-dependent oxidoreductase [Atopobium sp.]MDY4522239.1 FAD-dependent oxidoreductase [Atopobium sp.]